MADQTIRQILEVITKSDSSALRGLGSDLDTLGAKAEGTGSKLGTALKAGAVVAAAGAVGVGGALVDATLQASKFDDALLKTQALAGASKDEMDGYRQGILDLTKQVPVSAKDLADALFFVKSAGFGGADAMNILKISSEASAAGLGSVTVVSDAVTSALNAYKLSGQDAAKVTDLLTTAVTDGKASADTFAPALGRILPIAASMGVSLDQVTASMATMTRVGLSTDEASTALRGTLAALEKPGKQAQEALDSIGLSADGLKQSIKDKGLLATLQDLMDRTGGNVDTLDHIIPNIRALTGVLATAGSQGDTYNKILGDMQKSQGRTEDAFKTMSTAASFQMGLIKNDLNTTMIEIGSKILPLLTPILGAIAKGLPNVLDGIMTAITDPAKIPGMVQQLGAWFTGVLGKVFIYLKTVNWGQTSQYIRDGLIAGLGSAGDLVVRIGTWFKGLLDRVDWDQVWASIKTTGINLFGADFGTGIDNVRETLRSIGTVISADVLPPMESLFGFIRSDVAPATLNGLRDVITFIGDHKEILVGATAGLIALAAGAGVYAVAMGIASAATTVFGAVLALATSPVTLLILAAVALGVGITELIVHWDDITKKFPILGQAADAVGQKLGQFTAWLKNPFLPDVQAIFSAIGDTIGGLIGWVREHWDQISDLLGGPIEIAKAVVIGYFDDIRDSIHLVLDVIVGIVKIATDLLQGNWGQAWNDIKNLASNVWNDIKQIFVDKLAEIEGVFGGAWDTIKAVAGIAWEGIKTFASTEWEAIKSAIISPIGDALTALGDKETGLLGSIWGAITSVFQGIWSWFKTAWSDISNVVMAPFLWVRDNAGSALSTVASIMFAPFKLQYQGIDAFVHGVGSAVNWVLGKLGLKAWEFDLSLPALPPGLAKGTDYWGGGMAVVGEVGPEIVYLPRGAAVMPHEDSKPWLNAGLPGFQFGLDPGSILDKIGNAVGDVVDFAKEWIGKGADALVNEAFKQFNVGSILPGAGPFADISGGLFNSVKSGVVENVKELLGLAAKALPNDMDYPVNGPITQGFGPAAADVASLEPGGFHEGVDFGVPTGTTVRAALGGKVSIAGPYGGYGIAVMIDSGGGLQELYGHLLEPLIGVGTQVNRDQNIAESDNTGVSTGPHLHFEVRKNGTAVDPMPFLKGLIAASPSAAIVAGTASDWLEQAAGYALGRPLSPQEMSALLWLVNQESGGDPTQVNPTAVLGQHATGLLQTLPSTFAANMLPGHGNILNPVDNAIAAMRYILATYGDLTRPTYNEQHGAAGYQNGGIINEEIVGIGLRTGKQYRFGESGDEAIIPIEGIATALSEGRQIGANTTVGGGGGIFSSESTQLPTAIEGLTRTLGTLTAEIHGSPSIGGLGGGTGKNNLGGLGGGTGHGDIPAYSFPSYRGPSPWAVGTQMLGPTGKYVWAGDHWTQTEDANGKDIGGLGGGTGTPAPTVRATLPPIGATGNAATNVAAGNDPLLNEMEKLIFLANAAANTLTGDHLSLLKIEAATILSAGSLGLLETYTGNTISLLKGIETWNSYIEYDLSNLISSRLDTIQNTLANQQTAITFEAGSVVISASDIQQMQDVSDFFNRLQQEARAAGLVGADTGTS